MSVVTEEIRANASEIYKGEEICQEQTKLFLTEIGLPSRILPLKDIEECGLVRDTGFIWLKQKQKIEYKFEKIGTIAQYASEITAYAEPKKLKRITGIKTKELLMWITVSEVKVDDSSIGKLTFKSSTGLHRSFPISAFEVTKPEEVKGTKSKSNTSSEVK
ncbi:hypothetical protein ACH5RR_022821 [Cinchona calisaya]|uniref:DUF538 domain-containing protein n=1 Tax=Cinchona calisaya TaxID=153742 RepID=A0ABD2ZAF5_9GENT